MKKLTAILAALVLALSMNVAIADAEKAKTAVYKGFAGFILADNGLMEGTIELEEDIPHLFYQHSCRKAPRGTQDDGTVIRQKTMSVVDTAGKTDIYARVEICETFLELVREAVGEDLTIDSIVQSTTYWYGGYSAHVFFTSRDQFAQIGRVYFKNSTWCDLYIGIWEGDDVTRLGFRAGYYQVPPTPVVTPEPTPAPTKPCTPCKDEGVKQTIVSPLFSLNVIQDNSQTVGIFNFVHKQFEIFKNNYQKMVVNAQPCKK